MPAELKKTDLNFRLPELESSFLRNQLIAYIGNKRRLLGFLGEVFEELAGRCPGGGGADALRFGDCFAGSGSVSRLAKLSGCSTAANDWEFYSEIINTVHIKLSQPLLDSLFSPFGGYKTLLAQLNSLSQPTDSDRYISRYYAPASTEDADYRFERLFYTTENALFIDAVRSRIEDIFPGWELGEDDFLRKCALLAPLLYQAATHANTNGVFKAYHKGFGGHGGDALKRIMAPMRLQMPLLTENLPGRVYDVERSDAACFASGRSFDICYLDPPYNQHQYGSNYFMLNTIARWDRPEVPSARTGDGRFLVKAGIRSDWKETRSGFCYAATAPAELDKLLSNIDARYVVLSYNTEGIIPFDDMFDILSRYGRTEIFCRDYVIYRGGRQSLARANRNVEFQLVLSKREKPGKADRDAVDAVLRIRSIISLMNEAFVPERICREFKCGGGVVELAGGITAAASFYYRFTDLPGLELLSGLSASELDGVMQRLELCRCSDRKEEADVLMDLISGVDAGADVREYRRLWTALFGVVRKFAFRKYRRIFEDVFDRLERLVDAEKTAGRPVNSAAVDKKITELKRLAQLRFKG